MSPLRAFKLAGHSGFPRRTALPLWLLRSAAFPVRVRSRSSWSVIPWIRPGCYSPSVLGEAGHTVVSHPAKMRQGRLITTRECVAQAEEAVNLGHPGGVACGGQQGLLADLAAEESDEWGSTAASPSGSQHRPGIAWPHFLGRFAGRRSSRSRLVALGQFMVPAGLIQQPPSLGRGIAPMGVEVSH